MPPEVGRDSGSSGHQPLPLCAAVQGGHRFAAPPIRDHAARRAGQAAPASRNRPVPGRGCNAGRVLRPEPVLASLQASRRRHAKTVPDALKNRLKARKSRQETGRQASIIQARPRRESARTHHTARFPRNNREGTNHHVSSNRHPELLLAGSLLSAHGPGRRLQSRGHDVVYFQVADLEPPIRAAGLRFRQIGREDFPPARSERGMRSSASSRDSPPCGAGFAES